jgi:acetyl-CoA acyltransferase
MQQAVIVDVVRTGAGRGKAGGALSGVHPANLLATVLTALIERNDLDPASVDDVIAGCVSQVGDQGLNIARTATLLAGLADTVPATTIDRQCGSSQQAAHFAAQGVMAGAYDVVIAAGVESMSRVPLLTSIAGQDPHGPLRARFPEGLVNQGVAAELIAAKWKLDRNDLDEYAARSHRLAAEALAAGRFDRAMVPVDVTTADGDVVTFATDETVRPSTTVEKLAALKPAFYDEAVATRFPEIQWAITAGNSSQLTDGAGAVLIMSEAKAEQLGLRPRARLHSFAVTGSDPLFMLTGVIPATQKVLARAGLSIDDVDIYEVNEAFASVPLAWARELNADVARLNPWGGAIALGHPLGGSGARLLSTLVTQLEITGGRYGLLTMCEGGGMANATLIERL